MLSHPWEVVVFGGLAACAGGGSGNVPVRFRTAKTALLLGYLACRENGATREEVADQLWPGAAPDAARHNLRMCLSFLRRGLEPPGAAPGSVVQADRTRVRLRPEAVRCDVRLFEGALGAAGRARSAPERARHLEEAVALYAGPLLPEFYDDWVITERSRLEVRALDAMAELIPLLERAGRTGDALRWAGRGADLDPGRAEFEAAHRRLLPAVTAAPPIPHGPAPKIDTGAPAGPRLSVLLAAEAPGEAEEYAARFEGCIARRGGAVVARIGGGRFDAVFPAVSPALACAGDLCHPTGEAGTGGGWRAAVHAGEWDGADGDTASPAGGLTGRTADLLLAAHAGQALCSSSAALVAREAAGPAAPTLKRLGRFRFAPPTGGATAREEEVFALAPGTDAIEDDTPRPPRPPWHYASALGLPPAPPTRFFGREGELTWLLGSALAPEAQGCAGRLFTLTGPGGVGKTRLALEAARRAAPHFGGAVWFVPLSDLARPDQIPEAVARAVLGGAPPDGAPQDAREAVAARLGEEPAALLVLDNHEHLLMSAPDAGGAGAGADFVTWLSDRCPNLICLVTSRQPLGVGGEREFRVSPLPRVEADPDAAPEEVAASPAVALFLDRARARRPDLTVTARNAADLALLCDRLEGVPLALELAAARAALFTPRQMLAQLESGTTGAALLVGGRSPAAGRHRSLTAAVEWSYRLLPESMRRLSPALSLFRGTFSLPAVAAVCLPDGAGPADAFALLEELHRHSLLEAVTTRGDDPTGTETAAEAWPRFRMLEAIRSFAEERCEAEERASLSGRFVEHFRQMAASARPELTAGGRRAAAAAAALSSDWPNLSAAVLMALEADDETGLDTAVSMALDLSTFFWAGGVLTEGYALAAAITDRLLGRAPSATDAPDHARLGRAARLAGSLAATLFRDEAAERYLIAARDAARIACDRTTTAAALRGLANLRADRGDLDGAEATYEECLRELREVGDLGQQAVTLVQVGACASRRRDHARAATCFRESVRLHREAGTGPAHLAWALGGLAKVLSAAGDVAGARLALEEALAVSREANNMNGVAVALCDLGHLEVRSGTLDRAEELFGEALPVVRAQGHWLWEASVRSGIAEVCRQRGDVAGRRLHLRRSLSLLRDGRTPHGVPDCVEAVAHDLTVAGETERPVRLLGAADALRERYRLPAVPAAAERAESDRAALRARLAPDAFRRAWEAGGTLPLERAADEALAALAR